MAALLAPPAFSLHRPALGRPRTAPLLASLLGHGLLLALPLLALKTPLPALPPSFSVTLVSARTTADEAQRPAAPAPPRPSASANPSPHAVSATKTNPISIPAPTPAPVTEATLGPAPASVATGSTAQTQATTLPPASASAKPGPTTDGNALAQYGQSISEWLARQQRYPRLAEMRGWEGEVRLHLRIARKGALIDVQISRSSGHEVLDRSALQLVQGGALPPPPANLGLGNDETLDITIPVHYRLRRT